MQKDLKTVIYDLETDLLKSETRSSRDDLDRLLANNFREFGSSGEIYGKKQILEILPQESQASSTEFSISDFEVQELAEGWVLATFKTAKVQSDKNHAISLRSSLWRKKNNRWQMVFHQGTRIK